jgi:hypothetical protein
MNLSELKALQTPLLILLLVALIAFGAVYQSDLLLKQSQQQLQRQQQQLKEAVTRLQRSGDEKALIMRYLGDFQQLQRVGFVGDEQRINWLDALRLANQQTGIFGVDYEISAQKPYVYESELNPGSMSLRQSVMKLQFRLLHEEDLVRFFNVLARQGAGMFTLDQCTMQRIDTGGVLRFQPNLSAHCELSWITAQARTEKKP